MASFMYKFMDDHLLTVNSEQVNASICLNGTAIEHMHPKVRMKVLKE